MTFALLAPLTIRMSALLAAALLAGLLLGRKSAALRHAVLATAVCGSLAIPLLSAALPQWQVAIPARAPTAHIDAARGRRLWWSPANSRSWDAAANGCPRVNRHRPARRSETTSILGWVWAAGAAASLLLLVVGLLRLTLLTRRAHTIDGGSWHDELRRLQHAGRLRRVTLLQTDGPSVLLTWGTLRPCIVLPRGAETWSPSRIRFVLEHEAEHIRRGDWLLQIAAEALRAPRLVQPAGVGRGQPPARRKRTCLRRRRAGQRCRTD